MTVDLPSAAPRRCDETIHWVFLIMATVVLALSLVLRAPGGEVVTLPLVDVPLPGVCTLKRTTGLDCPGCGLTRSFISLAHGDLGAAWRYNPAGVLLFAAAAFQIPFRLAQIGRIRRGAPAWRWRMLDWCVGLLAAALVAQWFARTIFPLWL